MSRLGGARPSKNLGMHPKDARATTGRETRPLKYQDNWNRLQIFSKLFPSFSLVFLTMTNQDTKLGKPEVALSLP
jgi:hypothetical protein